MGLQDPMLENDRVLDNQTVEAIFDNLRSVSPGRRAAMVAQIVPFLGAFLAELLRAINLAQMPAPAETETIEDEDSVLMQVLQPQGFQDGDTLEPCDLPYAGVQPKHSVWVETLSVAGTLERL